ncbi:DUF5110 domain-containing protein [bacterium]|nr:DUF5110 domain-containing protein [bacterium]
MYRKLLRLFLLTLCAFGAFPALANYEFIGNVVSSTQAASSIELICEQNHRLTIQFINSGLFRVTLARSGRAPDPLNYPLTELRRELITFDFLDSENAIEARSSKLILRINKQPCRISVFDLNGNLLSQDDPAMGIGWDGNEVRCWKTIAGDDKFYGLGSKGGSLNRRGHELELWNTDYPAYNDRTDPLYQSIPFFFKVRDGVATGYYFNNSYHSHFNFGAGNDRYYSFAAEGGDLDYFFMYGPEIDTVMKQYASITGTTPLPPLWSLGYQQCRWSYYPDKEVLRLADTFREKEIPADVIYLDIHYMDDYRIFTWHPERFPQPKEMLGDLEKQGFKVVTIIDPGVKADSQFVVAQEGLSGNHFVRYPDESVYVGEVWPGKSYFPDFSRSETRDWWGGWIGKWLGYGVDGSWIDMNEPAVWGQAFPLETIFNDEGLNSSHKKMHNLYGLLMAKATYEGTIAAQPNQRPFVLTRAGFAVEQRYSSVWTGDNVANEEHLALGIRMVQGLSMSGIPFCGTDVGGFIETPSPELWARWIQVGAFSPLFRAHTHYGSPDQEPWSFGEDIENISKEYISLRYRLLPYLYSLFYQSGSSGAPVWKPLFYCDQTDPNTYSWDYQHQFFVGEKLMVAPVTKLGQNLLKVYLPEGKWLNWHTEETYEGPGTVVVDAPLHQMPIFLREGAIIPSRETTQYTTQQPIQRLQLDIFPASVTSSFDLYEDDGLTFDYRNGKYRLTSWRTDRQEDKISFEQSRPHDAYKTPSRELVLRFHSIQQAPIDVLLNEEAVETARYKYDDQLKILTITLPKEPSTFKLSIS